MPDPKPRRDVVEAWRKYRAELMDAIDKGGGPAEVRRITGLHHGHAQSLYYAIRKRREWLGLDAAETAAAVTGEGATRGESQPEGDDLPPPPPGEDWTFERMGSFARCWSRPGSRVQTVEDLLRVAEVDPDEWVAVDGRVNSWPTSMKIKRSETDPKGTTVTTQDVVQVDNIQVSVKLERRVAFDCPPLPPVPDTIRARPVAEIPGRAEKVCLLIPDPQYGYRWAANYTSLEPLHDPYAIDCAIQLAALLQPDEIINLGDLMDLAAFGRYRCPPELRQTTSPSIWACHWDFLQLRLACPNAVISVTPGNHDDRPAKALMDGVPEAVTVRGVGEDTAPLDLPGLLKLDDLRVRWLGEYQDSYWLWSDLTDAPPEITHGTAHGAKVWTQINGRTYTIIQGHCHRRGIVSKRVHGPHGSHVIDSISPGCVCRVDGAVPGASKKPDWQQGVTVLHLVDGVVHATVIPIIDGVLVYNGHVIRGRDRSDELAAWMTEHDPRGVGWPQVARHSFGRAA